MQAPGSEFRRMDTRTESTIELANVEFRYPGSEFQIDIESLQIGSGSRVAVIGSSGSGKTTLLQIIAGILQPARGLVKTAGVELTAISESRRRACRLSRMGLVFQEFELLEYLNVLDNILLPYHLHRALPLTSGVRERARMLGAAAGIERLLNRSVDSVSHGERQRIAICRALLTEPAVILADEPTGNLDPVATHGSLNLILEQAREHHATLLLVTHDHSQLHRFDRVVDLNRLLNFSPAQAPVL